MDINFYNTLTHRTEVFQPLEPPQVYMYNCGPTVYDYAHIGNFRSFTFADVLRRTLELTGYEVHQVMNITDVGHMTEDQLADGGGEDKMAVAMARMKEAKKAGSPTAAEVADPNDPYQIAEFYTQAFLQDARALRLKVADEPEHLPRATQHIEGMLAIIRDLVDKGYAYQAEDGAVYFSVEEFPDYGKLSGNTLDKIRGGAGGRILDQHQVGKRHPADFLLWKPDPRHIMRWDSPFGEGYPGWHIECSAMALGLHGREQIDIHTGGEDNIFPHHECEIAQSCCHTGKPYFARYWLHARLMFVEGRKMSKSLGNFYLLRDLIDKGVDPVVVRYELMKGHYRSNLNFTMKGLEDAASAVRKVRDAAASWAREAGGRIAEVDRDHPVVQKFLEPLADDLNVSGAMAVMFDYLRHPAEDKAEALAVLQQMDSVLALLPGAEETDEKHDEAAAMCAKIDEARRDKDFATADRLRDELIQAGYEVKTTKEGTVASKKLA